MLEHKRCGIKKHQIVLIIIPGLLLVALAGWLLCRTGTITVCTTPEPSPTTAVPRGAQPKSTATASETPEPPTEAKATATVTSNGTDVGPISVTTDAHTIAIGEEMNVVATVRDEAKQPVKGELVVFFGSLGVMSPASGLSNASGKVTATFTAGSVPGQATITVLSGYSFSSITILIEVPSE